MHDVNDMAVFVRVAELGSLSGAGHDLRLSPAVVSNRIAKLEDRLGVRLLNRTTRKVQMTEEGQVYFDHCVHILQQIEEVESTLSEKKQAPKGVLKVTMPTSFGKMHVSPIIPDFMENYPDVEVRLQLTERMVSLVEEGMDIGIRVGKLDNSSMIARTLAPDTRYICGAPDYLKKHGIPKTPADLADHNCLLLRFPGSRQFKWTFLENGEAVQYSVAGNMDSNNSEVLLQWALAGQGLVMKSTWETSEHLQSGALVPVLTDYMPQDLSVSAIYPHSRYLPPKVRVFIDFLAERFGPRPYWDANLSL
ncbi:LysR family transcriptional regulator [Aestuariispira insulae]|uniref:LysR family transcriptional regulator n=1 Tax=Aestuariispira insulae TaxID=1461337 RepID=A0A3D9HWE5_9PROT|nr:LysR family transcriptional regulator [Aestuariispira insulae]RED53834.1 LysR family transcriptional regulator [Aestuariispira insulae]